MYRKIAWSQIVGINLIKTRYALISVRIPLETLPTNVKLNKNNKDNWTSNNSNSSNNHINIFIESNNHDQIHYKNNNGNDNDN